MLVIEGTKMSKAMTIFVRGGNKVTAPVRVVPAVWRSWWRIIPLEAVRLSDGV
jgi:hypothetical protein